MAHLSTCRRAALSSGLRLETSQPIREQVFASMSPKHLGSKAPLILLVDDDRCIRSLLRQMMEQEGYQVAEAANGEQALEAYIRLQPDVVLLDAMMPVMDGFTCCTHLQSLPGAQQTQVLMITALNDSESVDKAFEVGAMDYVTKPIHWAVLRQRVRRVIQQSYLYQQLEAANQELQRLVTLDGLTQVANRRCFEETLDREWRRMAREKGPLSLILCDVDCFKLYNDTYGHQAGDRCLKQVAQAMRKALKRPGDLVARYGGEEFAAILPNTDSAGALHVAYKIRLELKKLEIPHTISSVSKFVTLSLGVASIGRNEVISTSTVLPAQLVAVADKALYQAKQQGRDTCVASIL